VPDDGVSKLDVEVDTQSGRSVVVRVDGAVAFSLAGLAGGAARQPDRVAIGIVGAAAGESALTVAHDDLTVAIQPANGGAPVVVTAGALPTAPQSPQPTPPPAPPTNLTAPAIAGTPVQGVQLTVTPGNWQNADSVQIRWSRCAADGTACRTIQRASGASYTLAASDVGSAVRAIVTATNDGGATTATSAALGPVASATPLVVAGPALAGTPMQGETLTATAGTWTWTTGPATLAWSRCDPNAGTCTPVAGATGTAYVLGEDDIGSTIRVTATVPGARGPSSASATTTVVVPAPPASLTPPTLAGSAIVGRTLTADPGAWSKPAPTLTYAWLRCAKDGSGCTAIDGATAATYVTTADDAGSTIEVSVTGTNISGTATAVSAATAPILGPAKNLGQPSISGDNVAGSTLTADTGSWDDPNATLTVAWQRCTADGATCTPIDGADDTTYTLTDTDIGATIGLTVTATNAAGATTADADRTPTIVPPAPPDDHHHHHHHHRGRHPGDGPTAWTDRSSTDTGSTDSGSTDNGSTGSGSTGSGSTGSGSPGSDDPAQG
jgi:hypothetical protein